MTPCCRRRGALSAIIGMVSAIDRNTVRLQSESVAAFVGIRTKGSVRVLWVLTEPMVKWIGPRLLNHDLLLGHCLARLETWSESSVAYPTMFLSESLS